MKIETEEQHIEVLQALLARANEIHPLETGSCVYSAGNKTHCAEMSESQCKAVSGMYSSAQHCKKGASGTKECEAS